MDMNTIMDMDMDMKVYKTREELTERIKQAWYK